MHIKNCPQGVHESYGYKYMGNCQCALITKIRTELAHELESSTCSCDDHKEYCSGYNNATLWAAKVVRGL